MASLFGQSKTDIEPVTVEERVDALVILGDWLRSSDDRIIEDAVRAASFENPWFTPPSVHAALEAISGTYLARNALENFVDKYPQIATTDQKSVGVIMAGNIPLVGFHDLLCVFLSGHRGLFKPSERDQVMITLLINKLEEIIAEVGLLKKVSALKEFDAVIATGGNTSAKTFRQYFAGYPHLIRSNRNAIAILTGEETDEELVNLGQDVFQYFGLGCRSVSKLYVPPGYQFDRILSAFKQFESVMLHKKYKNNYDYNFATLEINRIPYMTNGSLLLREDDSLTSRIGTLHYEYYEDQEVLLSRLIHDRDGIQCIIGNFWADTFRLVPFGSGQMPRLDQFADGADTMKFLGEL